MFSRNYFCSGKTLGQSRSDRTRANMKVVKRSVLQSPARSVRKFLIDFRFSDITVLRNLHLNVIPSTPNYSNSVGTNHMNCGDC